MARTLVGRLQLVVQAMGLGEAKKVEGAMSSIERAAKRLSSAQWGQNFQHQLEKMALGARELDAVRKSWNGLQRDIASRGLTAALKKSEISAWKTATLGQFAAVRSSMRQTEKEALRIGRALKGALRPAYVMAGGYTGAYMAGTWGREALNAASEAQRVRAEAKFAGLSGSEQSQITSRAEELSGKYRLALSDVLDMLKETTLSMPNVDAALKVSDANARAQLLIDNTFGSGAGVQGVRAFAKSMDLLERLDPNQYISMLDGFVKMQQILGKDIDPSSYYEAVKYSRTGGKVGSDEFMSTYLPMLIAETGGANAGNSIRAGFDQFVIGRASKQALAAQESYGLRKDGKLVGQDEFGANPIKWIYDVLLPQLEKQGVDTQDKTELARVVGQLSSNRLSSDEVIGAILNMQQVFRYLDKRVPNAAGLSAADDVQKLNPFAAYSGFKGSLANLSDAVLPMEAIGAGLNRFADYINAFTKKVREGDSAILGATGAIGLGAAGLGAWKTGTAVYGLITAGTNLNVAAAALQAAAVAQGGGGVLAGGAAGAAGKKGIGAMLMNPWALGALVGGAAVWKFIHDTSASNARDNRLPPPKVYSQGATQDRDNYHRMFDGVPFEGGWHRVGRGAAPPPGVAEAKQAGQEMQSALSPTGKPTVDVSALQQAVALAQQFLGLMNKAMAASQNATGTVDAQIRRAHSDFGVAP
ncbi:hypothetical protein NKH81_20410 [Mesorhizobium sp. M0959]|uniref:hypothetical protein n=1 Tax=Mesorhizobium sp. M0959 TaxID=2957034 RepID=UPI003334E596